MANHPHDKTRPTPKGVKKALEKGDMDALRLALSPRQRRFAEEYVIDFNGEAAVIRAGYSHRHADRQAYTLKRHEGVAALIDHLARKEAQAVQEDILTKEYVVSKILKGLNKAEDKENLTAYFRACELLARHLGMLTDKQEVTGRDGEAIQIQKIQEDASAVESLLAKLAKKKTVELV